MRMDWVQYREGGCECPSLDFSIYGSRNSYFLVHFAVLLMNTQQTNFLVKRVLAFTRRCYAKRGYEIACRLSVYSNCLLYIKFRVITAFYVSGCAARRSHLNNQLSKFII